MLDVAAAIHIESVNWPDYRAADIYISAWQVQLVAIGYARHEIDKHTAELWIDAGKAYRDAMRNERVTSVQ